MDKREEHDVELLESGEDSTKSLQSAKQPLDFVATPIHGPIVVPGADSGLLGRHDRNEPEIQGELARLIALVGAVHEQVNRPRCGSQLTQQLASFRCIVGLSGRERKRYGRSSIRGNQMNLGSPSAAGLADGLGTVFF